MNKTIHPIDLLVGHRVRLIRLSRAMSQTELAQALGISFQQVQKYEKGTNRISASKLYEIAKALDIEITTLFADGGLAGASSRPDDESLAAVSRLDLGVARGLAQVRDEKLKRKLLGLLSALEDAPETGRSGRDDLAKSNQETTPRQDGRDKAPR